MQQRASPYLSPLAQLASSDPGALGIALQQPVSGCWVLKGNSPGVVMSKFTDKCSAATRLFFKHKSEVSGLWAEN